MVPEFHWHQTSLLIMFILVALLIPGIVAFFDDYKWHHDDRWHHED